LAVRLGNCYCLEEINAEHDCPRFVTWLPGNTPKEHEDMTILEQVRAEQQQFREDESRRSEKQRQEDRHFQQQIEALYEKRHQELRDDEKTGSEKMRTIAKWSVIGTAISAVAAVASAAAAWWVIAH